MLTELKNSAGKVYAEKIMIVEVGQVTLGGQILTDNLIPLTDDGQPHEARVLMG
jgi:hypothetical protein